jgi:hypothetical protein
MRALGGLRTGLREGLRTGLRVGLSTGLRVSGAGFTTPGSDIPQIGGGGLWQRRVMRALGGLRTGLRVSGAGFTLGEAIFPKLGAEASGSEG